MYMGPIAADTSIAVAAPASTFARRAAGIPVLIVAGAAMLPWLAINAAVAGVVLGARGVAAAPRALVQAIDYAGSVALGR